MICLSFLFNSRAWSICLYTLRKSSLGPFTKALLLNADDQHVLPTKILANHRSLKVIFGSIYLGLACSNLKMNKMNHSKLSSKPQGRFPRSTITVINIYIMFSKVGVCRSTAFSATLSAGFLWMSPERLPSLGAEKSPVGNNHLCHDQITVHCNNQCIMIPVWT
jgi:hypothetical protein